MEYLVGVVLGLVVGGFAALSGFDRDRAFYPTALIVIASYYALFAVMGASSLAALATEIAAGLVFLVLAVAGFRWSLWLAAAGIAGHGAFDFLVHPVIVTNPGMPPWWPGFCGTIDFVIGGWLAGRLLMGAGRERGGKPVEPSEVKRSDHALQQELAQKILAALASRPSIDEAFEIVSELENLMQRDGAMLRRDLRNVANQFWTWLVDTDIRERDPDYDEMRSAPIRKWAEENINPARRV